MNSPITGKQMLLKTRVKTLPFRKENFTIVYQYYLCEDTNEEFVTPEIGDANLNQVYNAYRVKHGIPFPEEIKEIREKYGLPANKMAEVLGLGINMYRAYENGEIPNSSNARLIRSASNPEEFRKFLPYAETLSEKEQQKVISRINQLLSDEKELIIDKEEYIMDGKLANEYTGYKIPNLNKALNVVLFFAKQLQPWQTSLNKLLFYSDFGHYKSVGQSITGLSYRAITYGVVPRSYGKLFAEASDQGLVEIRYQEFDNYQSLGQQYISKSEFNPDLFTSDELITLEKVAKKFSECSASDMVRMNHEEKAWIDHIERHELVSYQYSFYLQHI